jgi:phosphatidylserine decarboxylase
MRLLGNILTGVQYLLPHHLLSSLVHWFMRIRIKVIKNTQISLIGELVGVDWSESKLKSASDYENFNAFFTRELAPGARPVDPDPATFVAPSDGRISQCGRLTNDRILQAKGRHYTLRSLLADNRAVSNFYNGFFHTIYLSPRDYHRVHMPMSGHLQGMIHVPGRLFSVAPYNVSRVPDIFARNERVISLFDTRHGPMAIILVGAMLVSSIETTWSGVITPPSGKRVSTTDWSRRNIHLVKGQEMGRFNMGSTVIVLLPANAVSKLEHYEPDDIVVMGQKLGRLL